MEIRYGRMRAFCRCTRAVPRLAVLLLITGSTASAQELETSTPTTRADAIAEERAEKIASLWPERQSPMVTRVNRLVERGLGEGLDSGKGANGPQLVLGGMRSGQGMSVGIGYRRSDLWRERIGYRATARGTLQGAYMLDFNLDFEGLRTERTFMQWYTKLEDSPGIDYYGAGNDSSRENQTHFAYRDVTSDVHAGFEATRSIRLGVTGGYMRSRTARGNEDFPPIDEVFSPQDLPGFGEDTRYTRLGVFAVMDSRDSRTGPRRGGLYGVQYREYWDLEEKAFAFRQTNWELQQYLPYFNGSRVVALRAAAVVSFPKEGNQLPVYLQPVLGGNDDLRGFARYRFRDNHSVYLGVEHRWHVSSTFDMAVFIDAGKVVPLTRQVDGTHLKYSGGIGLRVRLRSAVITRIDFAGSREGVRAMWTFSDIFQAGW